MQRILGHITAALWIWTGLLGPVLIGAINPDVLLNNNVQLAAVLMLFAAAGSNIVLYFTSNSGIGYSPIGVPIVIALIECSPPQAMLVASIGYLCDIKTWRSSPSHVLENAGLAAMTTGISAVLIASFGWSYDTHGMMLVMAVLASITFLTLDALTYAIWYQLESKTGMLILKYFVRAAPLDITFTAVAVTIAGPFGSIKLLLALALLGCQVAIYALYRMVSSEARHREQSHHLRDVFGRYVPETIVEQLSNSNDDVHLGGEERLVTVMFCDIRGFTNWAENQSPEKVVTELNALLGSLAELVLASHGTLDKFTGDGLMAFWGAPIEQPDHAERACRTAFAMHDLLAQRARDANITAFQIGIGITSGTVVVGNVGHEKRLEYTAIGDTVNLAARLEQSTKELHITTALSHDTWELLPDDLKRLCPETATVHVRGRKKTVVVHELIGPVSATDNASDLCELHII